MKIESFELADVKGLHYNTYIFIINYVYITMKMLHFHGLPRGFSSLNHPLERVQFLLYC